MPEWVPTKDGTPLRATDAMLDELHVCYTLIARLEAELDLYRRDDPTWKPGRLPQWMTSRK